MTGTVRERGPGRWQVQIGVQVDGRRRQVARTVRGTRADALAVLPVLAAEHGVVLDGEPDSRATGLRAAEGEPRPFDLQALLKAAGATMLGLAAATGQHARTLHRWAHMGLTVDQADRLAVAVGFHPAEVWPAWWDESAVQSS